MMRKIMRGLIPAVVLSVAVGLFTGCSSNSGKESTQGTTKTEAAAAGTTAAAKDTEAAKATEAAGSGASARDTLILATANETPSVTSNLHNAVAGDYINAMTYNTLFIPDENLVPQPSLVESYENPSDVEWVFHLKKGVKFHNGEEMTAKDVEASIELCKESPEVSQYARNITEIEIIDDYTIKFVTDGPQAGLLSDLCSHGNAVLPADLIESGHDFNKEPIGTGPYILKAWNKGESLELEAFPDYFDGEAPIKNVIWKIIPEGSSRTMALEAGEVDLIVEVETTDVARLQDNDKVTVFVEPSTAHNFMMINNEIAPFNNVNFRKAIDSAIDKAAIVQVALNGNGSVCDAMVPDCFAGTTSEGAPTYDVEKAKAYLAESGLNPADCGFAIICSDDTKLRAGQVIQSSLKENLGIDVTLESMDLATYLDVTATGDYQAAIGGYKSQDILSYVIGVYHSNSIGASNKTRTNDPQVDALIEKMRSTVDVEENQKLVTEFSKMINEMCPFVPLYMQNNTRAYNSALTGFNCNAAGKTDYRLFSWSE